MADFTAEQIREMARNHEAMPDGSYPIPDRDYLERAIKAVGRGTNNSHAEIRQHIIARAKALGASDAIPDGWGADGMISKGEIELERTSPVWKDDARRLVYGVVLTPGLEDSQQDVAGAEEIEKAAHRFLVDFRKHDVQHAETAAPVDTVESYIAPVDFELTDAAGEKHQVLKGSWVMTVRVNDQGTWDRVQKGELTGFSIGGSAVRVPLQA